VLCCLSSTGDRQFLGLASTTAGETDNKVEGAAARGVAVTEKARACSSACVATQPFCAGLLSLTEMLIAGPPENAPRFDLKGPLANTVQRLASLGSDAAAPGDSRLYDPTGAALLLLEVTSVTPFQGASRPTWLQFRGNLAAMQLEQLIVEPSPPPFPIYPDPTEELLRAHVATSDRDPAVAHILGVLAGYAYGNTASVATMASRLGMAGSSCLRINETVDAMFIFSTAYLIQSRCGRVAVLCYRGTETSNLVNWLGDADVGSHTVDVGGEPLSVHSGFYRNMRATLWPVIERLHAAARGEPLPGATGKVEHPLEALYVAGHSLGGAMAVLFALCLAGQEDHRGLRGKLRAVYTFGQPLAVGEPLPRAASALEDRVYRHVYERDVVPSLPPAAWGHLQHFGHEYHYSDRQWRRRDRATVQLASFREAGRSLLGMLAPVKRRRALRYTMEDHAPHHYISALRPAGRATEFGDYG